MLVTATAVVGATCILALPLLLGVPYGLPPAETASVQRTPEPGALLVPPVVTRLAGELRSRSASEAAWTT